jgi:hypothetical protein
MAPYSVCPLLPLVLSGRVIGGNNTMSNINFVRLDLILVREERINTPA